MIKKDLLFIPWENQISIINTEHYKLVRIVEVPESSWICGVCLLNKNIILTGDCSKVIIEKSGQRCPSCRQKVNSQIQNHHFIQLVKKYLNT